VLGTRFWTAVKTGTSKDMRDNWAIGWSQRYTVGVWVGNASGAAMHDVSGVSGAAPIWAAVMGYLHARQPSRAPAPPAGVVQAPVQFGGDLEAARAEWFIAGTQQAVFAIDKGASSASGTSAGGQKDLKFMAEGPARILAPTPGTIVALDPDIPPARQRLTLEATGGAALRWRIDDKEVAQGPRATWPLWPGRHRLELVDARGQLLDAMPFEVRGAGVRSQ
jgi:penicillin-binding protein 1C